jgi:predicted ester cyclase
MSEKAAFNRDLGLRINREIWNARRFDKIALYFTEDFVSGSSANPRTRGREELQAAVEEAHATFEGFREEIKSITADDERVVIHFTIKGRQVGRWGPLAPTGKEVAFDEIVIMTVRDGRVCAQTGVIDNLTGLRQVGAIPIPRP